MSDACPPCLKSITFYNLIVTGAYYKDKLFLTEDTLYLSTKKYNDQFMIYSERFQSRYGKDGYVLDYGRRVKPSEKVRTIDFGVLFDVLTSSDEKLLEEHRWMFEGDCKFLNK